MKILDIAAVAAAAFQTVAAAPTTSERHDGGRPKGLGDLARKSGLLYFGTAIDNVAFNDSRYLSIAYDKHEFSQVTPSNGQKWMYTEPSQGVFNFTAGDQVVDPAVRAGQLLRCHALLWHNQLPDWLTSGTWTREELLDILENHIKNVVTHYAPTCYAWDVVNEAFDEDGTLRSTIFSSTIGPDYIAHAFRFARKHAPPTTKLYYNDYNIETINAKSDAARALVRSLLSDNTSTAAPLINGIGLQSHFIAGSSPSRADQAANMEAFLALSPDIDVAITELDVRVELPNDAAKTAQQASDYADAVGACVDNAPRCVGVTVWDFYDPLSWVPSTFPGEGDATLFWANYTRKPAYYSIADVLRG
ncbi:Endo-1,4-beta-xylanase A [Lasiodiplodia theobromae]|uniref:Endo-1,4-beta-xylanase A n=1 Tax=Lasiodiplodia theobromae TaxID=45133 RepID=UPI0015C35C1D|nr:Endo-1,4-beta-xylanase A [Lasiodiplodia theobromae]KAF4539757.1 Endo-1,4-beta-xylanase A [Lasiodiplodia theobromae]